MFDDYMARWSLTKDGEEIVTSTGRLLPVRRAGIPAMLKISEAEEEIFGGLLGCRARAPRDAARRGRASR